jgi:2-polyprenyl-6-methoxyphenol hydroxylase-like FAD-dependent oxidoreductase
VRKQIDDGMLLIGDAAGLAYPQSGEGIRPAVESALMAAATIMEADGDYSMDKMQAYSTRLTERRHCAAPAKAAPQFCAITLRGIEKQMVYTPCSAGPLVPAPNRHPFMPVEMLMKVL